MEKVTLERGPGVAENGRSGGRASEGTTPMDFLILGPTVLLVDGEQVPLGSAKQRALLAVLLTNAPSPVPIDVIVDYLWHGQQVDDCRGKLHPLVSRTRAQLREAGLGDVLVRDAGLNAYRLDVARELVDLDRFRRLLREARAATQQEHPDLAIDLLTQAVRLWRGEPLAEARGARVEHLRRDLQASLLDAERLLASNLLATGRHEDGLAVLEPLIVENPIDEALAELWVRGLRSAGRESEARVFARQFRRRYRKVVGSDPILDLVALLRSGEPARRISTTAMVNGDGRATASSGPAGARPQQLPNDIHDFIGHAPLLAELDRLLEAESHGPNAIVLTGPPGVGKTTIARHWAFHRQSHFPDGQLYLNAEGYGAEPAVRPADALHTFLVAFGVPRERIPNDLEGRRDRFNRLVNGRRVLIVLDNILNSEQVRPLLPASPTCLTIVTCRSRLTDLAICDGIGGITVPELPVAERQALLGRIIGASRTDAQPAALRSLANLSGGFPLALRVIGEHVLARPRAPIDELVVELSTRLLDCDGGEDPDTNLRTVFAWSYQALRPAAARLFRLLGLFAGSTVDAGAAGALLGVSSAQAERELDILARAHLINHDTARRYRLHDLLRRYAADCGRTEETSEEQRRALLRLLDWYLLSAANAVTLLAPEQPSVPDLPTAGESLPMIFATDTEAMRWCEAERTNLIELSRSAVTHGFHRRGWQIPGTVHETFDRYGRQNDVLDMFRIALTAAEADGHPLGQFGTLVNLGAAHFAMRDYREAARRYEEALAMVHRTGDPGYEAVCLHNLAAVYLRVGRVDEAVESFTRALDICDRIGDTLGRAYNLRELAGAYSQTGRFDQAKRSYLDALEAWRRIGSLRAEAVTRARLAGLYLRIGQPRPALAQCERALTLHRRVRDEGNLCEVLITAADARRALNAYADALTDATAAIAIAEEIADTTRRARGLAVVAETLAAVGDRPGAYHRCQEGLDLVDDIDDPEVHEVLARLLAIEALVTRPAEAS